MAVMENLPLAASLAFRKAATAVMAPMGPTAAIACCPPEDPEADWPFRPPMARPAGMAAQVAWAAMAAMAPMMRISTAQMAAAAGMAAILRSLLPMRKRAM
jgi:hypothetical protein